MNPNSTEGTKGRRDYFVGTAIGAVLTIGSILVYLAFDSTSSAQSEVSHTVLSPEQSSTVQHGDSKAANLGIVEIDTLTDLVSSQGGFAFTAALHRVIAKASEEELASLLEKSQDIAQARLRLEIQRTLGRGLAARNPRHALNKVKDLPSLQQPSFVSGVFQEWSYLNPDDAINAALDLARGNRSRATRAVLIARSDLSDSLSQKVAKDHVAEVDALLMAGREEVKEVVHDPGQTWELLINDDLNDTYQLETLVRVAELWVEKDGVEIISRLYPDGMDRHSGSQAVTNSVVAAISAHDPEAAFEYVLGLSGLDRYKIPTILATWAETNPNEAINALSKLELDIEGESLRRSFVGIWAQRDQNGVIKHIKHFEPPMQLLAAETAIGTVARTSPQEAVKLLEIVADVFEDTSSIEYRLAMSWAPLDPNAALEWVLDESRQDNPRRSDMLGRVVRELTKIDPESAFDVSLEQPVREYGGGMESDVIRDLCRDKNIELAIKLLPRVREESMLYAVSSIGDGLITTGQSKRALLFGEELPESQRTGYYLSVASSWASAKPLEMLEELPRLPDEQKSSMAAALAKANKFDPVLSDEQMEHVKTFLNEEDAESVEFWENL